MLEGLKERVSTWAKNQNESTISNQGCPLCTAESTGHRMDATTYDIWCTGCGSEWEHTGEKVDTWREYELVSCPEEPSREGETRSGYEWSQMKNDLGTEGIHDGETSMLGGTKAVSGFGTGAIFTTLGFPALALFPPLGALMILVGIPLMLIGIYQYIAPS